MSPRKPDPKRPGKQRDPFKLEVFVRHVLIDGNKARAWRAAGGASESARQQAHLLMQDPEVQALIEQRKAEALTKIDSTLARSLTELAAVAYSRIDDAIEITNGVLVVQNMSDIPERAIPAIAEVKQVEGGVQIKLHPKLPALLALARHHGLKDAQRHELTGPDGAPLPVAPPATVHYHLPAAPRLKRAKEG
jgi:phage terminase small subunit